MKREPRCCFYYVSGDGEATERIIRDWVPSALADSIDAHCELRKEQRTFNLKRMARPIDLETGEAIANPWSYFGLTQKDGQNLNAATWQVLSAIKALKFFTLTTRGFRERESNHLIQFIQEICSVPGFSKTQLEDWLEKLWCGDIYNYRAGQIEEYENLLLEISGDLMPRCRQCALRIARGSGRRKIPEFWLKRIESEFSKDPQVVDPHSEPNEGDF